jgi:hypothetical protein
MGLRSFRVVIENTIGSVKNQENFIIGIDGGGKAATVNTNSPALADSD